MFQETSEGLGAPLGNVGSGQWAVGTRTSDWRVWRRRCTLATGAEGRDGGVVVPSREWKALPSQWHCLIWNSHIYGKTLHHGWQTKQITTSEFVLDNGHPLGLSFPQNSNTNYISCCCSPDWERTGHHLWPLTVWFLQMSIWEYLHHECTRLQKLWP